MQRKNTQLQSAQLTLHDMKLAIDKINLRLCELKGFDVNTLKIHDSVVESLETKLERLLSTVFGTNTYEYARYKKITNLYVDSLIIGKNVTQIEYQKNVKENIDRAISVLEALKNEFEETITIKETTYDDRILKAYQGLELHPEISRSANSLFQDGHYSNAVEDAVKALNAFVRLKSGVADKDGVSLMQHVFSPNAPILKFNDLSDGSDKDEQTGFMGLFVAAVTGLRNPRAHKIIKDDPERALEFIAFISLLAKLCDEATRN